MHNENVGDVRRVKNALIYIKEKKKQKSCLNVEVRMIMIKRNVIVFVHILIFLLMGQL